MDILKAREKAKRLKEKKKREGKTKKKVEAKEEEKFLEREEEIKKDESVEGEKVEEKEILQEGEAVIFETPPEEQEEEFIDLAEEELQHMFDKKLELYEGVTDYLVFEIEGENYALRLDTLKEIIRCKDVTEVPGTPPHISGIIALRGNIIPIVDIKRILSISDRDVLDPERNRMLLVEIEGKVFGFKVDEVKGVKRIPASKLEPPPPTLSHIKTEFIASLVHFDRELITVLDMSKIVAEDEERK